VSARGWRRLRRTIQSLSLVLFLYLFVETSRRGGSPLPVNLFSRLDPLLAAGSMLAARRIIRAFAPALAVVLATLALGRVWCGWICPLGTLLDLFGPRGGRGIPPRLRRAKHFLLFALLFAALFANLTLIALDPLTALVRTLAGVVYPGLNLAVTALQMRLRGLAFLRESLLWIDSSLRGSLLPYGQPPVRPLLALPLLAILALNLLARRFWCRYLCPLGALLGLASRMAWLKRRVGEDCSECGLCARECPMGAIAEVASDPGECILCLDCLARCPRRAITFGASPGLSWGYEYDPSRRQLLASLAASAVWVGLLRTEVARRKSPHLLRPPGAGEDELLARCVRCGRCFKVCPTSGLQPALLEAGWEGVWTPVLVPRLGYCDYSCASCGQVCPSGAIPPLSLAEKRRRVIGTARVDQERCIGCLVCEEMCPVPTKAIEVVWMEVGRARFRRPRVIPDLCIGCGSCEYHCPVPGEAAIRVYPSRAKRRRGRK